MPVVPRDSTAYVTALAHLYRAEMQRMTVWRQRLDNTTHWALLLTMGVTTFTLGSPGMPHFAMLLALSFNLILMLLEGRRYQRLHHARWRLSLLEHNFFGPVICPSGCQLVEPTWERQLRRDLQNPHFTLTLSMGTRLRLRRNYLLLMYFTTAVWLTKLFIHPSAAHTVAEIYQRMAIGTFLPSWFVAATGAAFVAAVTVISAATPSEEALEHWSKIEHTRFLQDIERR